MAPQMTHHPEGRQPLVTVEMVTELNAYDISELCDATEEAIDAGGGFGWLAPPPRTVLEDYWRGALLIPNVTFFQINGWIKCDHKINVLSVKKTDVIASAKVY